MAKWKNNSSLGQSSKCLVWLGFSENEEVGFFTELMTTYSPWCMHGSEVRPPPNTAVRLAPYSQELFGKSELLHSKTI